MGSPYTTAYFSSRYAPDERRDNVWKAVAGYLQRYIPETGSVLDVGAGYCFFINHISAAQKHALDIFPGFTEHAKTGVHTHVGSCTDLRAFSNQQMDAVFASNVLEHLTREETRETLHEIRRVLKPGGRLLVLQPNFYTAYRNYFDDYTHIQVFSHAGLADLLATNGFHVDRVEPGFLPFSFKSRWPAWSWLVTLYLRLPYRPLAKQMLVVAHVEQ